MLPVSTYPLRREDSRDNHNREGQYPRLKRPHSNKSASAASHSLRVYIRITSGVWILSPMHCLTDRRLLLLTVIDLFTRECLGICLGQNLLSGVTSKSAEIHRFYENKTDLSVQLALIQLTEGTRSSCSLIISKERW